MARDHQRGVEAGEQLTELAAAARVEPRGRLVEQQQPRAAREGAREAQPALLPALRWCGKRDSRPESPTAASASRTAASTSACGQRRARGP